MATTHISSNVSDVSSYASRMVTITVTGMNKPGRPANQTLSVPYSRFSQTMRNINRNSGKIVDVSVGSSHDEAKPSADHAPVEPVVISAPPAEILIPVSEKPVEKPTVSHSSTGFMPKTEVTGKPKRHNSHSSKKKKK